MRRAPGFLALFLMLTACAATHDATAQLSRNGQATMTLRAMFGIHSDWHRTLRISDGKTTASLELFEDTGWWRGSHLYLHSSGAYVVHEGQNGCFAFTLMPIAFDPPTPIPCDKARQPGAGDNVDFGGYPASKFYDGLFYVGR